MLTALEVSSTEEYQQLVHFAAHLDDGEAHTCALAITGGARLATDDKKALRVFTVAWRSDQQGAAGDPCLWTSQLLFDWARRELVAEDELNKTVRAVTRRASFFPPKSDPHYTRWRRLLVR